MERNSFVSAWHGSGGGGGGVGSGGGQVEVVVVVEQTAWLAACWQPVALHLARRHLHLVVPPYYHHHFPCPSLPPPAISLLLSTWALFTPLPMPTLSFMPLTYTYILALSLFSNNIFLLPFLISLFLHALVCLLPSFFSPSLSPSSLPAFCYLSNVLLCSTCFFLP